MRVFPLIFSPGAGGGGGEEGVMPSGACVIILAMY